MDSAGPIDYGALARKADYVRRETLKLHGISPETRIASCLSDVEIFTCLFYGGILKFDPSNPAWKHRDRLIVSKGHGGVSLYPILGDVGFYDKNLIYGISHRESMFSSIPDCTVPGIETVNGSLGLGLGVGAGMCLALRLQNSSSRVVVLCGDGELYEGAIWEAAMFAAHQHLGNLTLIVDKNGISMLDYCRNVIDLEPLDRKFSSFGWDVESVDGHDIAQLHGTLGRIVNRRNASKPFVCLCETIKGKGVPELESDPLCHIRNVKPARIAELIGEQS